MRKLYLALAALFLGGFSSLGAADLTFVLDQYLTGDSGISGSPVASFTNLNANQVRLTMDLRGLSRPGEFVSDWYFNIDPSLSIAGFGFAFDAANSTGPSATASITANAQKLAQGGNFDLRFSFDTSNSGQGISRLETGEYTSYLITHSSGLDASDFSFFSTRKSTGSPVYLSGAHIQGLVNGGSVKVGSIGGAVPEPGIISLLGMVSAGALVLQRKRQKVQV